ncbi:heterokaryon incompatibility protein-domain-containing protein [Lasiosphaeria ovina]|uniref:Heterokaryon incompatibility protein-domain-containing protein n=1 Tax=Lasiosphaeria ovina TaxID=92902 RepID=A0AAE0KH08_9PEZI|nr:heterokaryon incompatibility protein-domain-containing protein [Lasiosphaeria ovina]
MAHRSLQLYAYEQLQLNEIRLLKVTSPSDSPEQWDLTLVHTPIDHAPPYETISYVWGLTPLNRPLALSTGAVLHINENLERVLNGVVRHCSTGYLWADRICINQADTAERNHQVQIMGQIYRSCLRVFVWLGCDDDLPECSALDFVCDIANAALGRDLPKDDLLKRFQTVLLGDVGLNNGELAMRKNDERLALWQLFKYFGSPWFSRAWVFQEIVLPQCSSILIGSSAVSLEGLYWICEAIDQIDAQDILPVVAEGTVLFSSGLRTAPIMRQTWRSLHLPGDNQSVPYPSITKTLSSIAPKMNTSVPPDRVYAFLGLNLDPRIQIEPDYEASELEVHVGTAKSIIQGSGRLDIFEYLCRSGDGDDGRPFTRRTPTWAPDFTSPEHLTPFSVSRTLPRQSEGRFYPHIGQCDDSGTLTVHGRKIDSIQTHIDPRVPPHIRGTYFDFSHYVTSAVDGWELSEQMVPSPTAQAVFAALVGQGHCDDDVVARAFNNDNKERVAKMLPSVVRHYHDRVEAKPGADDETLPEYWGEIQEAVSAIYRVAYKRYLFVTCAGQLALGCTLEPGDEIWVLHGCSNPVALRPTDQGTYCVQETCFLEGWMDAWGADMVDWKE